MYIDPEIIECIHRFIDGLCGMPYHVEHLNEKGANAVDALSDDINILFSDMPFMKEKHYCESIINKKTHIIQGCKFGKRYINNHPLSFCVTELSKMIEANVIIKRCKTVVNTLFRNKITITTIAIENIIKRVKLAKISALLYNTKIKLIIILY